MSQARRNLYLQQLGIVQYVGKDLPVLPGLSAQPKASLTSVSSPEVEGSEIIRTAPGIVEGSGSLSAEGSLSAKGSLLAEGSSSAEGSAPESMFDRVNTAIREKSMAELVNIGLDDKQAKPIAVKGAAAAKMADSVAEPEVDIQVRFALWQASDDLLVCSAVEDSLPDPEQILLLGNILQVMGQATGPLPQMELVEWPPYPNMAGGESDVREFLATLIQARVDSRGAKIIMLMGDDPVKWLLSEQQKAGVTNGQVDAFGQVTALLLPSLKMMIDQPGCKRDAWQTIRFLSPLRHVHKVDS
jgi:DNA polymerase III psi subunit